MDTQNSDSRERLVRVESTVEHLDAKVKGIETQLSTHETTTAVSFAQLRENGVRQQIATENLVKAIEAQGAQRTAQETSLHTKVAALDASFNSLKHQAYAITVGGGLVWVLLGSKLLTVLGLK